MIELEHAWGQGKSHKYIAKIGNRYFYSQDEIQAFKEGAQKKAGNAFDTARKGALTVKKKADSVPRIQKHGSKYYVADKKTQRKIEKSGAGGNQFYKDRKGRNQETANSKDKWTAKTYASLPKGKTFSDRLRYTIGDSAKSGTASARVKARESAYSKYELGNVTKVNQGKAKVKQIAGDATKKADNVADKFKKKTSEVKDKAANAKDTVNQGRTVVKAYKNMKNIEKNNKEINRREAMPTYDLDTGKKLGTTGLKLKNANETAKLYARAAAYEGYEERKYQRSKKKKK